MHEHPAKATEQSKSAQWKSRTRILIAFIFVFAAVLVVFTPSFHDKGVVKNEATAVSSLEKINTLEREYAVAHPTKGFACELSSLRQPEKTRDRYDATTALLAGEWSGYKFTVASCTAERNGTVAHYQITAVPIKLGGTGAHAFCTDDSRQLFYDNGGSPAQCLALRRALDDYPSNEYRDNMSGSRRQSGMLN